MRGEEEKNSPGRGNRTCRDSKARNHGTVDKLKEAKYSWSTGNKEEKKLSYDWRIMKCRQTL